ncbi:MAG: hypothetical protein WBA16_00860 [Nonlabens sp.]
MKSLSLKLFIVIAGLSLLLFVGHSLIVESPRIPLWKTYVFLGMAAFITVAALRWIQLRMPDKLGMGFLSLVTVKLGLILFIFPELIDENESLGTSQLLGFLGPYFIFLFLEIGLVLKWLNDN